MTVDITAWLANLQPGDKVGVYVRRGSSLLHEKTVERRTPSGRIICVGGATFRPDGYNHVARGSAYADRRIMPLPDLTQN